jgi:hypothetical protein
MPIIFSSTLSEPKDTRYIYLSYFGNVASNSKEGSKAKGTYLKTIPDRVRI